jgi:hypothetical protein
MTDEELLFDLYYNKHNYDNANVLYHKAKIAHPQIKLQFVKDWLNKQQAKQQTKTKVGKKQFLPIYSELPYSFQIDLTFFPRYEKQNKGNTVLFTAININTRFAYAYYGKNKDMKTIINFLKEMEKKTIINSISCDSGREFNNTEFIEFCDKEKITIYFITNDSNKLGIINKFHRTLKNKLTQHFIATDNYNWIEIIDKIIDNYNHTVNRGIGIEPHKVNDALEHEIIIANREKTEKLQKTIEHFKIGDKVRIINKREVFGDKILPKYSNKVFVVDSVHPNACEIKFGDTIVRVKNDQLLKVDFVENPKEDANMKEISRQNRIKNKLNREKLQPVVLDREKRLRKPNSKYL